jgi:hypothetical protein
LLEELRLLVELLVLEELEEWLLDPLDAELELLTEELDDEPLLSEEALLWLEQLLAEDSLLPDEPELNDERLLCDERLDDDLELLAEEALLRLLADEWLDALEMLLLDSSLGLYVSRSCPFAPEPDVWPVAAPPPPPPGTVPSCPPLDDNVPPFPPSPPPVGAMPPEALFPIVPFAAVPADDPAPPNL